VVVEASDELGGATEKCDATLASISKSTKTGFDPSRNPIGNAVFSTTIPQNRAIQGKYGTNSRI